jgi:NAD(P)-dependent dehydrogenase (short-subunit alcohol dehydrogenase family)
MSINKRAVALITGCNGGIGKVLCQEFAAAQYVVIGTDLHATQEIDCDLYLHCDLEGFAAECEIQQSFQQAVQGFIDEKSAVLQAVISNAAYQHVEPLGNLSVSEFNRTQQINLVAPYTLAHLFESLLRKANGSIVNIGSVHARLTKPGFCAYSTSKAALSGLTRALALEFSGEVTVNCILPAATATEMLVSGFKDNPAKYDELVSYHPAGRIADPLEIARLALFLCSENARFITGSDIPIDGGIGSRLHDPA